MTTKDYRESIDYNALAAEMMGYEQHDLDNSCGDPDCCGGPIPDIRWCQQIQDEGEPVQWGDIEGLDELEDWNPLQDRNQAYQLLKRAEELGLAKQVAIEIEFNKDCPDLLDVSSSFGMGGCSCSTLSTGIFWLLTCPTDIMTKACVDVWLGSKE